MDYVPEPPVLAAQAFVLSLWIVQRGIQALTRRRRGATAAMIRIAGLLGALAVSASAAAAAAAASFGHGPVATAPRPHHKPCRKAGHGCHWIEISSFSWGVGRGITAPTHGVADREGRTPSIGEITVHKPKRKGH